jgi:hypothetical protein
MTTPPSGEDPNEEHPNYGPPPPVPPGYPPYPPPPPGYPYGHAPQPRSRIAVGLVFAGSFLYFAINFAVGFAGFMVAGSQPNSPNGVLVLTAVALAAFAFAFGGGGGLLLFNRSPKARGLGLGLMIGWALTSLFTAGFCTGLNPGLYAL